MGPGHRGRRRLKAGTAPLPAKTSRRKWSLRSSIPFKFGIHLPTGYEIRKAGKNVPAGYGIGDQGFREKRGGLPPRSKLVPLPGPDAGGKSINMVEYVLDEGNERIFASRYQLELPSKEQLRHLLTTWRQEAEEDTQ